MYRLAGCWGGHESGVPDMSTGSVKCNRDVQPTYTMDIFYGKKWKFFKGKVEKIFDDWRQFDAYLNTFWKEGIRSTLINWAREKNGEVWVVSACGTVPIGAVGAGMVDGEAIWLARTTHKGRVLPAALLPSKHSCIVHAGSALHFYTKYQVLCNADVEWIACRSGKEVTKRALCVARDVFVGRVLHRDSHLIGAVTPPAHRCHVVIFGRRLAFDCFELLAFTNQD